MCEEIRRGATDLIHTCALRGRQNASSNPPEQDFHSSRVFWGEVIGDGFFFFFSKEEGGGKDQDKLNRDNNTHLELRINSF